MQLSALAIFFEELNTQLENVPNEVRRLFHGRGQRWEGLEQITCDWLQGQLVVNLDVGSGLLQSWDVCLGQGETELQRQ